VNVPIGAFALVVAARRVRESRDAAARRTDVAGLVTFSAALFLIVLGLLRGNDAGWGSAQIVATLAGGAALLAAFVVAELRQERPMLDLGLFRNPPFVGVQVATFFLGAGMFALFPFLSIYLQDVLGNSPLGAGLRFLPITAFVFVVPLVTRRWAARAPMWLLLGGSLAVVAAGLALLERVSPGSSWTVLLPGFVVMGIGIGLANPTIAGAALRVVDPTRTGMASGISNTSRIGGLAVGVAALGATLQQRIGGHLAAAGYPGKELSAAVSSAGLRAARGDPRLANAANTAFVSGFRLIALVGCLALVAGSVASLLVRQRPSEVPEVATATTSP
jgi:predicted MFS family arabinose efflux permease